MPVNYFCSLVLMHGVELTFLENTLEASCLTSFLQLEVKDALCVFSTAYLKPGFGGFYRAPVLLWERPAFPLWTAYQLPMSTHLAFLAPKMESHPPPG